MNDPSGVVIHGNKHQFNNDYIAKQEHSNSRNLSIGQNIIHNVIWPQMTQFVKQATDYMTKSRQNVILKSMKAASFSEIKLKRDWKFNLYSIGKYLKMWNRNSPGFDDFKETTNRRQEEFTEVTVRGQIILKVEAMAGHNESEKKSSDAVNDLQTFRAENLQSNMKVIYYSRTFLSIIGGVIAGILGFTGLTGFVFYFLVMAITSVALIAKAKFSIHTYFDSWNRVVFDGFLGGLMSFVLFWTYPLHYLRYLSVNILENYNCNSWLALVDDIGLYVGCMQAEGGRTRVLLGTDTRKHMRQGSCSVLNRKEAPLLLHIYNTFELKYGFNALYPLQTITKIICLVLSLFQFLGLTTLGKPLLIQFCMNTALSLLVGSKDNNLLSEYAF
ncbi:hypothetical protein NC651_020283 [Populus alba x Populus x berolinensis]|nr:hypothetical protein NC651_020283 [Populus alba x Populus x berolinensis]